MLESCKSRTTFFWADEPPRFIVGKSIEWNQSTTTTTTTPNRPSMPPSGFGGLSRRRGKKPVIAAVNGIAHGGGTEIIVNTDIVLASPAAKFALPEVKRGVAAIAGALPRLVRTVGRQRAMEMALTGREVGAEEARGWGLVNEISATDGEEGVEGGVVELAVKWAGVIAGNSPDSVVVSKAGVELGWDGMGVEEASGEVVREGGLWKRVEGGENMTEGVRAFVEKRGPRWVGSKL